MIDLGEAAAAALDCLGVTEEDAVLVACNPSQRRMAEALVAAAGTRTRRVELIEYPALTRHGEEPPAELTEALGRASVLAAVTRYSLSHTAARIEASERGVRIASMPELDEKTFAEALPGDYAGLAGAASAVADALTSARECRLSSAAGTELVLRLDDCEAIADDGDLRRPGAFGNLPAGEAYIAPIAGFGEGTIVVDGSLTGYGALSAPLRIDVEAGRLACASGEAADWLVDTLDAAGPDGRLIAELGVGVNPNARLAGTNCLVDEKAAGTAHVAFGDNAGFGGTNSVPVHIDATMRAPRIELDGKLLSQRDVSLESDSGTDR